MLTLSGLGRFHGGMPLTYRSNLKYLLQVTDKFEFSVRKSVLALTIEHVMVNLHRGKKCAV